MDIPKELQLRFDLLKQKGYYFEDNIIIYNNNSPEIKYQIKLINIKISQYLKLNLSSRNEIISNIDELILEL